MEGSERFEDLIVNGTVRVENFKEKYNYLSKL